MNYVKTRLFLYLFLMIPLLCGAPGEAPAAEAARTVSGSASWFGEWHHGKRTANGELFNMHAMTAAHRTLPFGTVVRVTNKGNDESVLVRINDRGPYHKRRILDLSYGAAGKIDMQASGVASITMTIVSDASGCPLNPTQAFYLALGEPVRDASPDMPVASAASTASSASVIGGQGARLWGSFQTGLRNAGELVRAGIRNAESLLFRKGDTFVLGPFEQFREAEDILLVIEDLYPDSSIVLLDRDDSPLAADDSPLALTEKAPFGASS